MTKKFLVINCDPMIVEWLTSELGPEVQLTRCVSVEELSAKLAQDAHYSVMAYQANGNGRLSDNGLNGMAPGQSVHVTNGNGAHHADDASGKLADQVDRFEQLVIERTLARHANHRKDTAAELGISRVTLYNKMKKFGMLTE